MSLRNTMYGTVPSLTLELVGMFGLLCALVVIIAVKSANGIYQYADTIEKFSAFAYAVIKLLPCITFINTAINNFTWYKVSIDSIKSLLITKTN